jgi:hypothetical protein
MLQKESDNKYKLFRNFMANDLNITREDIKNWTIETIEQTVSKLVGQINIEDIVRKQVRDCEYQTRQLLVSSIAKEISDRISLTIKN